MNEPELNYDICTFCAELIGHKDNSNYFKLAGSTTNNRIIWKNSEFALLPSLGSLVEGHLLLIPTHHVFSFSNLPDTSLEIAKDLINSIMLFWSEDGKQTLVFEHGSIILASNEYEKRVKRARCGACTDHAHIHILPNISAKSVIAEFEKMNIHIDKMVLKNMNELCVEVNPDFPYIFLGGSDLDLWLRFVLEYVPSQFMRKLVSSTIGLSEWDWRQFPRLDLVQNTIQKIGPRLKEWLKPNSYK